MAFRTDRASLSLSDLQPPRQRADGSWVYDAIVTRSGVFEYELEDGQKRREWRPPEEISKPESLETLHLAPVVGWRHTRKGEARGASVGTVGQDVEWVEDGSYARASVVVRADDALQAIQRGDIGEVSCGYEVDLEESAGTTPDGQRYDAIQRGMPRADGTRGPIVYEHLAIVPTGRQGPQVALRTDSAPSPRSWRTDAAHQVTAGSPSGDAANQPQAASGRSKDAIMAETKGGRTDCGPGEMSPNTEDKKDGTMPPDGGQPPAPEDRMKLLEEENAKLKAQLAKMQAAQDAPPAQPAARATDAADESKPEKDPARMDAAQVQHIVRAHFEREELARTASALGVEVSGNAGPIDIKRAIVEKLDGKPLSLERYDSSDSVSRNAYIGARYDMAMERHRDAIEAEKRARVAGSLPPSVRADESRVDSVTDAFLQQQKRMNERSQRGSN